MKLEDVDKILLISVNTKKLGKYVQYLHVVIAEMTNETQKKHLQEIAIDFNKILVDARDY
jgi:hypothetical protein